VAVVVSELVVDDVDAAGVSPDDYPGYVVEELVC
jgi:hypothetical protein